jgi:hypothetical protein
MHRAFFGDREREFSLTPHLIPELERLTGKGIAAIVEGVRRASFSELVNTIRLGLIGGGAHPEEASSLVNAYVKAHPLGEVHLLALDILNDLWTGPAEQPINDAAATGDLSAAVNGGAA